ncbi:MAG: DUF4386 domain-containing protein [Chloroflexi bacterium]|nr:DUF4386 domain-containing protein [Chloroflexota bacterium]
MTTKEKTNPNKTAKIAGSLYLIMSLLGAFGILYVPSTLIVQGDMATTANNIMANESLFRLGIVGALSVQIVQIFLVLALYKLLKPVNQNQALFMVIFILVAVPIAMLNELNHFAVLLLLNGVEYLTAFTTEQLQAQLSLFFDLHEHGIFIAQIFWGLWLFPMGYLIVKSGFLPKIIGVLLFVAGFGYLVDSFIFFLIPDFGITFSEYTFLGELLITFWLLIKGVNVEQWKKHALESA